MVISRTDLEYASPAARRAVSSRAGEASKLSDAGGTTIATMPSALSRCESRSERERQGTAQGRR